MISSITAPIRVIAVIASPAVAWIAATRRAMSSIAADEHRDPHGAARAGRTAVDRRLRHRLLLHGYLKQLPVDELKVDRTFVLHMDADHDDAVLVRGAIELGHNLGMTIVAEGVEGAGHVAALQALGCDIAQGHHYARPMPAMEISRWIRARQAEHDLTHAPA